MAMIKKRILLGGVAASFLLNITACGIFAGGVSEETNNLAAVPDSDLDILSSSSDEMQVGNDLVSSESSTSDSSSLPPGGVSVDPPSYTTSSSSTLLPTQPTSSDETPINKSIEGRISGNGNNALDLELRLPETSKQIKTDVDGKFDLDDIPAGTYPLVVKASETSLDVAYLLYVNSGDAMILGPVPTTVVNSLNAADLIAPSIQMPKQQEVLGQGNGSGNWGTDIPQDEDNVDPLTAKLPHSLDYGAVYQWENPDVPANMTTASDSLQLTHEMEGLTVDATFTINSIVENSYYHLNIVGKDSLFHLAVVNGVCNTKKPSLAIVVGKSWTYLTCGNDAITSAEFELEKELNLTAVWEEQIVKLYLNGFLVAIRKLSTMDPLKEYAATVTSETGIRFGDEGVDITFKSVHLGNKAISSADVLYRYYQKGGAR